MKHLSAALLAAVLIAPPLILSAQAHVILEKSDPAQDATVSKVPSITLHFSGALEPARSGATLVGPTGKILPVATSVGTRQITLLTFHLAPGHYRVNWHGAAQDNTRAKGSIAFTVDTSEAGTAKPHASTK